MGIWLRSWEYRKWIMKIMCPQEAYKEDRQINRQKQNTMHSRKRQEAWDSCKPVNNSVWPKQKTKGNGNETAEAGRGRWWNLCHEMECGLDRNWEFLTNSEMLNIARLNCNTHVSNSFKDTLISRVGRERERRGYREGLRDRVRCRETLSSSGNLGDLTKTILNHAPLLGHCPPFPPRTLHSWGSPVHWQPPLHFFVDCLSNPLLPQSTFLTVEMP